MTNKNQKIILIAAGGTGGHVIPALVLANELITRGIKILFVTDSRGSRFIPDDTQKHMTIKTIRAGTIRKNPVQLIKDLCALAMGIFQSFDIIRDHAPSAIVGFGGYPSFPPVLCGQILQTPTILHSADAVVGQANRMLAKFCTRLALSFPNMKGLNPKLRAKTIVTGLPIRPAIENLYPPTYKAPDVNGPVQILIMGGSQGAGILGEKLVQMLCDLPPVDRARLRITHQVRLEQIDLVRTLYHSAGITATCASFINDIPEQLKSTHLFIGRSGASTVVEMMLAGIPSIFIPLIAASHKDAQQHENANILADIGGAILINESDFTTKNFLAPMTRLLHDPGQLTQMATTMTKNARPHAARALADLVLSVAR
jgi:UDP-N-acetylglucosamine--N-acetylmuramyl-(pentapeptide) pyrophosphoryl-undecaprenol N-acetylglucosamine transferase